MNRNNIVPNLNIVLNLALLSSVSLLILGVTIISPVESQKSSITVKIAPGASNPNNKLWYDPQVAIIQVGQNVTWINLDSSLHTVTNGTFYTGPQGTYDSGILNSAQTSRPWVFESTGTFSYYCTLHPFMFGQILVQGP